MLEGVAGRMFSGRIHPSELAGKLAREADLARFAHPTGPATANHFMIQVNPDDLPTNVGKLEEMLAAEMTAYTAEEGLRLEGPIEVQVEPLEGTAPGTVHCHVEVVPGPAVVWSRLVGDGETLEVGRNRSVIGRAPECDVVLGHDDISRRHALIFRERGQAWVKDLGSVNGTAVDGQQVTNQAIAVEEGSSITLSGHPYRFLEA